MKPPWADAVAVQHEVGARPSTASPRRGRRARCACRAAARSCRSTTSPRRRLRRAPAGRAGGGQGGRAHRPRELRLALLEEGGDALRIVVARPGLALEVALEVELGVEAVGRRLPGCARLVRPSALRRLPAASALASVSASRSRAASSTAFQIIPQAAAVSASSGSASRARAFARGSPRRRASDQVPPASGIRPILEKAWMNLRRACGQHDVAGERDVGAGAGGDAVDRADDRLVERADQAEQSGCRAARSIAARSGRSFGGRGRRGRRRRRSRGPRR